MWGGPKSSPHGLYALGYTRVTKVKTKRNESDPSGVNLKKLSQFGVFSETRKYEGEIVSNRGLVRHGESQVKFYTHRPSRQKRWDTRTVRMGRVQTYWIRLD